MISPYVSPLVRGTTRAALLAIALGVLDTAWHWLDEPTLSWTGYFALPWAVVTLVVVVTSLSASGFAAILAIHPKSPFLIPAGLVTLACLVAGPTVLRTFVAPWTSEYASIPCLWWAHYAAVPGLSAWAAHQAHGALRERRLTEESTANA